MRKTIERPPVEYQSPEWDEYIQALDRVREIPDQTERAREFRRTYVNYGILPKKFGADWVATE